MNLRYDFDYDEFEYELSRNEINEFLDQVSDQELIDAAEEAFYTLTKAEQEEIIDNMKADEAGCLTVDAEGNTVIDFKKALTEDKGWVISEFVYDELEAFEDEMKDYFYSAAKEQYEDEKAYSDDPYSYNGVRRSDFY